MAERKTFLIAGVAAASIALGVGAFAVKNYRPQDPTLADLRAEARACAGTQTEEERRDARMAIVLDERFSDTNGIDASQVYEVLDRLCPIEDVTDEK